MSLKGSQKDIKESQGVIGASEGFMALSWFSGAFEVISESPEILS